MLGTRLPGTTALGFGPLGTGELELGALGTGLVAIVFIRVLLVYAAELILDDFRAKVASSPASAQVIAQIGDTG
jgi:hypothetical protein